jgi:ABC-2 type transport system permease protein
VLYLALIALLSLGTATILREAGVAIGAAGMAIEATTGLNTLPISPWAGLGVLTAWAAVALLLGGLLLRLRDA